MKQPPDGGSAAGKAGAKPISAKRQKILEKAFAQLRKSRAGMDPKIITRIRDFIGNSPDIMKKLGLNEKPKAQPAAEASAKSISVNKAVNKKAELKPDATSQKASKKVSEDVEKIDQAKNMEIMARLMELKPNGRDIVKSAIKKASD